MDFRDNLRKKFGLRCMALPPQRHFVVGTAYAEKTKHRMSECLVIGEEGTTCGCVRQSLVYCAAVQGGMGTEEVGPMFIHDSVPGLWAKLALCFCICTLIIVALVKQSTVLPTGKRPHIRLQ